MVALPHKPITHEATVNTEIMHRIVSTIRELTGQIMSLSGQ